jgi:hypothetical protein
MVARGRTRLGAPDAGSCRGNWVAARIYMNAPPPANARCGCLELEGIIPPDRRHSRRVLGTFAQKHPQFPLWGF